MDYFIFFSLPIIFSPVHYPNEFVKSDLCLGHDILLVKFKMAEQRRDSSWTALYETRDIDQLSGLSYQYFNKKISISLYTIFHHRSFLLSPNTMLLLFSF